MKLVKFDSGFMVIDADFENEKILVCEHMICDLGDLSCIECEDCVLCGEKAVSTEELNIVEVEI